MHFNYHSVYVYVCFQAAEFREFWGDRSELRHFQDGSILEAVLWVEAGAPKTKCSARKVLEKIVRFALDRYKALHHSRSRPHLVYMVFYFIFRHAAIDEGCVEVIGNQLDPLLHYHFSTTTPASGKRRSTRTHMTSSDTGEEDAMEFVGVFDELRHVLRKLQLPLTIHSVTSSSPAVRYSDVRQHT